MSALAYTLAHYSPRTLADMREHRSAVVDHRITKSLKTIRQTNAKGRAGQTDSEPLPVARIAEFREAWAALHNTRSKLTTLQESDLRTALENHLTGRIPGDVWRKILNDTEAKLREREPLVGTNIGKRRHVDGSDAPHGW